MVINERVLLQNQKIKVVGPDGKITYREDKITDDEFAFNAVYTMACGGMVLSGDDISELTERNVEILRKLTPPTDVAAIFDDCFHRYIVGQCLEAVILGVLCIIGMLLLRMPYATMIGTLVGFTALIPIAGAWIGTGIGVFMILTVSPVKALIFLIFILILQQLENNLIYPKVVGSSMGLPGIWVLAAVTVGGGVMGIPGMVLWVPLTAAFYRLIREDVQKKAQLRAADADTAE